MRVPDRQIAEARAHPLIELVARDVKLKRSGAWWVGRCPFHDDSTPSFGVRGDYWACFAGCGSGDAITYVQQARRLSFPEAVAALTESEMLLKSAGSFPPNLAARACDPEPPSSYVHDLWEGADDSRLAELYLWSRGIQCRRKPLPAAIRGHRAVWCAETRQKRPAVLAALTDETGALRALQRIWCEPRIDVTDGMPEKGARAADLDAPKKTIGALGSAAVRLCEPRRTLGLAEGVETALAAALLFAMPVWATCGASRLGLVEIPAGVETVVIFGDDGKVGAEAAGKAARIYRSRGYRVEVEFPPPGCDDWCAYRCERF